MSAVKDARVFAEAGENETALFSHSLDDKMFLKLNFTSEEIATGNEATLFIASRIGERSGFPFDLLGWFIAGDGEGALDVQFAQLARGGAAAIVVQAIGDVRIFLQLIEQNPAADGMDGSGRHINNI